MLKNCKGVENMKKIVIALGMMLLVFGSFSSLNGQQIETASQVGMFKEYRTGRFEVSVHFGSWSLNPLQKMFEEELIDSIGDEVRDEVACNVRVLGRGGGYVLAPCHNIQSVSPPENVVAMYEAGYELGWY